MRFWMGVMIMVVLGMGFSTQALASPGVCGKLDSISRGQTTAKEIQNCHRKTQGAWYDFMALMICRDLNKLSIKGARAKDITACLEDISKKRFKYARLKQCKKRKRKNSDVVRRCIRRSRA